jgi:hypothetical protein
MGLGRGLGRGGGGLGGAEDSRGCRDGAAAVADAFEPDGDATTPTVNIHWGGFLLFDRPLAISSSHDPSTRG